jgi:LemA protein
VQNKRRSTFHIGDATMSKGVQILLTILFVIVALTAGAFSWGTGQYNKAVALDEEVHSRWAQVENQLKRRFDLIPNLVETVKGYARHESEIFTKISDARTNYSQAESMQEKTAAVSGMEKSLSRLLMLQENYPNLKANESYLKLIYSLEGTENRIAVERKRYNDAVQAVNTYRRTVAGQLDLLPNNATL